MSYIQPVKNTSVFAGTWNVHSWFDTSSQPSLKRIIQVLNNKHSCVNLLCVQEATNYTDINNGLSQIQNQTHLKNISKITPRKSGLEFGVALLTQYKILKTIEFSSIIQFNIIELPFDKYGVFNVSCDVPISKYTFASIITKKFSLNKSYLKNLC